MRNLKSHIVMRSEFTYKGDNGRGTRGSTPGDYVLRYMVRDRAVEPLTPAKLFDADTYITKYMVREDAVERLESVSEIKDAMYEGQLLGGTAFGYGDVSLSDQKLRSAARDIMRGYDERGKTIIKTVLSFDEAYLREHGLLDEEFEHTRRGDFRGHVDQMKLRMSIMAGLEKMSRYYDDLRYVGSIQVDTNNVHCHLAMFDNGRGKLFGNGHQYGILNSRHKATLRRHIDQYLDRKKSVMMLSSSVMNDRRNVLCYVKKFAHKTMAREGLPQFLMACLPKDRTMWRAGTNRKEMRKANAIVREYVTDILRQRGSGYSEAVADIQRYADYRTTREGLSEDEHNRLIRNGQERIIESCMNAVYGIISRVPESEFKVKTPMMSAMSLDYEDMAAQAVSDPMMEFGFRLRTYSSRVNHHRKEYHKFISERDAYDAAEDKHPDSKALGDYLLFEANYNAMLMVKYQYFMSFLPSDEDFEKELEELEEEKEALENLKKMRMDPAFKRMGSEAAEEYGMKVYGQRGGRRMLFHPDIIDQRIVNFEERVSKKEEAFRRRLLDHGMSYDGSHITKDKMYSFNDVKALDLHHLGYDFPYDVQVSKVNVDRFREMADMRYRLFQRAKDYLVRSGQEAAVSSLPETDVVFMKQYADRLVSTSKLASTRPVGTRERLRDSMTVSLGRDYMVNINDVIRSSVYDTQVELERESGVAGTA